MVSWLAFVFTWGLHSPGPLQLLWSKEQLDWKGLNYLMLHWGFMQLQYKTGVINEWEEILFSIHFLRRRILSKTEPWPCLLSNFCNKCISRKEQLWDFIMFMYVRSKAVTAWDFSLLPLESCLQVLNEFWVMVSLVLLSRTDELKGNRYKMGTQKWVHIWIVTWGGLDLGISSECIEKCIVPSAFLVNGLEHWQRGCTGRAESENQLLCLCPIPVLGQKQGAKFLPDTEQRGQESSSSPSSKRAFKCLGNRALQLSWLSVCGL